MRSSVILIALAALAIATGARASWNANGPDGGVPRVVDATAGALRIGTTDGVYISHDAGLNWTRLGDFPRGVRVTDVASAPGNPAILLAAGSDQIYRSTDTGAHWLGLGVWLGHVVFDPGTPGVVLATDPNHLALHRSIDNGATWTTVTLPGGAALGAVDVAPDPFAPHALYLSTSDATLYRSSDDGMNWSAAKSLSDVPFRITPDPFDSNIVLWAANNLDVGRAMRYAKSSDTLSIVVSDDNSQSMFADVLSAGRFWYSGQVFPWNHLFESVDHGSTWQDVATLPGSLLGADRATSGLLYGNDALGFALSTDAGRNWQSRTHSVPLAQTNAVSIRPGVPNEVLAAGSAYGVAISLDAGVSWQPSNAGLTRTHVKTLARSPLDALTVYAGTDDGLFVSADGGRNWSQVAIASFPYGGQRPFNQLAADAANPLLLTALGMWSDDGGMNWRVWTIGDGTTDFRITPHANTGTSQVYALKWQSSVDYVLYRAPSHGATFVATGGGLLVSGVAVQPGMDSNLIAFARDGQWAQWNVYRSRDAGEHWQLRGSLPLPNLGYEPQLSFDPCNPQTVYALAGTSFYASHDQGRSWSEDAVAIPSSSFNEIDARCNGGNLGVVAATEYAGAQVRATTVDKIFADAFEPD
jgi:hypothetical protein